MNMNRSGHMEAREPDWYSSRATDRAKLSPNTLETESMQNSFTSLNLDSLTVAADFDHNHYSVRSLPVISSSSNNARIATAHDAPWNESPRSLRTSRSNPHHLRSVAAAASGMNSRQSNNAPPAGVSALDHLQNSISSLTGTGLGMSMSMMNHAPPVRSIITEESLHSNDFSEDDTTEGYDILEGSFGSLRMDDQVVGAVGAVETGAAPHEDVADSEMDTTAHAGNVSRSGGFHSTTALNHTSRSNMVYPSSPQRSIRSQPAVAHAQAQQQYPSSPQRSSAFRPQQTQYPSSPQRSITSQFTGSGSGGGGGHGGDSVASRARYTSNMNASYSNQHNEPSLSTLGDGEDDDDDDNIEIIKLLSKQVETLKGQLLNQQSQNQLLQQQQQQHQLHQSADVQYNNSTKSFSTLDRFLPNDSIVLRPTSAAVLPSMATTTTVISSNNHGGHSSSHDYSECDSFGEDNMMPDDEGSSSSSTLGATALASAAANKSQQTAQLAETQAAIFGAIAALKASLLKQQQQKEHASSSTSRNSTLPLVVVSMRAEEQPEQQPHEEEDLHVVDDVVDDEHLLMDELVVCELEAHVKALQRVVHTQQQALVSTNAKLKEKVQQQAARIAQLEAAAAAATAATAASSSSP